MNRDKHIKQLFTDKVVIVGGGHSLKGFDFMKLKHLDCIACNVAFLFMPYAKLVTFYDGNFLLKYYKELIEHKGYKFSHSERLANLAKTEKKTGFWLHMHSSENGGINDTGHLSIKAAFEMGASEVYLLGFDGDVAGNYHSLYKKHGWVQRKTYPLDAYEQYRGWNVFNCNPDSNIKTFDYKPIETIL